MDKPSKSFYSSWNINFLPLILLCSLNAWLSALLIFRYKNRLILICSAAICFSPLLYFKYFGFFTDLFHRLFLLTFENWKLEHVELHTYQPESLLLPLGISFFTFQSFAYVVDVYRSTTKPEKSYFWVLAFVAFFPQLIAGPIERANNLLPQLKEFARKNTIGLHNPSKGVALILIGLVLKFVFADNLAEFVDYAYSLAATGAATPIDLLLAATAFSMQIYGDFCGYSLIAVGCAKLLGIKLTFNFNHPYFATDIQSFWRRWHITLSRFFRDYIYIPLGGNRAGNFRTFLNLFLIFLLVGLWHGANFTFIVWGFVHGAYLVTHRVWSSTRMSVYLSSSRTRVPWKCFGWFLTISSVTIAWIFFRAQNLQIAYSIISKIFSGLTSFDLGTFTHVNTPYYIYLMASGAVFMFLDKFLDLTGQFAKLGTFEQSFVIFIFLLVVNYFGSPADVSFIYFQF